MNTHAREITDDEFNNAPSSDDTSGARPIPQPMLMDADVDCEAITVVITPQRPDGLHMINDRPGDNVPLLLTKRTAARTVEQTA